MNLDTYFARQNELFTSLTGELKTANALLNEYKVFFGKRHTKIWLLWDENAAIANTYTDKDGITQPEVTGYFDFLVMYNVAAFTNTAAINLYSQFPDGKWVLLDNPSNPVAGATYISTTKFSGDFLAIKANATFSTAGSLRGKIWLIGGYNG